MGKVGIRITHHSNIPLLHYSNLFPSANSFTAANTST